MKTSILCLLFSLTTLLLQAETAVSFSIPEDWQESTIVQHAIVDACNLISQIPNFSCSQDGAEADILIVLSEDQQPAFKGIEYRDSSSAAPEFYFPDCSYEWQSKKADKGIELHLAAVSEEGIQAGIYGLLQEKLGFHFIHPRSTIMPEWAEWPLEDEWSWSVTPRFSKRGFHIHTQHPIELTEPLLNQDHPNGMAMIKEYLDWLARNGQNYMEFNLLNTVDIDKWIPYAKEFVEYGHERGIIMGIEVSFHTIQQNSYKLYKKKPVSFRTKKRQIIRNLDRLQKIGWDVYSLEFASTEYTAGNEKRKNKLRTAVEEWAAINRVKIMGRAHVVKKKGTIIGHEKDSENEAKKVVNDHDKFRGLMVHTVMFYDLDDQKAPVYSNDNLLHMTDLLEKEKEIRETWYYPESAYWVTFDNSVPMFLSSYLEARLDDILLCEKMGVPGHLTFSSGWEWGYWLIDWSIARWSWKYGADETHRLDAWYKLTDNPKLRLRMEKLCNLQEEYIKEKELIRYLVAQTVADELPGKEKLEFHPRPHWQYKYLFRKAPKEVLDSLQTSVLEPLAKFNDLTGAILQSDLPGLSTKDQELWSEFQDAFEITWRRSRHRYHVVSSIATHRLMKMGDAHIDEFGFHNLEAGIMKVKAMEIVQRREQEYRYDLTMLARKRDGKTAYKFGYLYPVSNLHFWQREMDQIEKNRWSFTFQNIWNIGKIMGFEK